VTPKAKDGCGAACGSLSGSCGSSWFLADFAHKIFSPPTSPGGH
jgi:hypothetical protein